MPGGADARGVGVGRDGPGGDGMGRAHRKRLLHAMAQLVAQHGYTRATIGHVVAHAKVSHDAFYELFTDRHDCFLALFDAAVERVRERLRRADDPAAPWRARVKSALAALLELFDQEPELGRLLLIESSEAGARLHERRLELRAEMIAALETGQEDAVDGAERAPLSVAGIVDASIAVVQTRLRDDALRPSLVELVNPLMAMIVLPYQGLDASVAELSKPAPIPHPRISRVPLDPLAEFGLRATYTTMSALRAIADGPGASNRLIAERCGISDEGQMSRLLRRLEAAGLIHNEGASPVRHRTNAWVLTPRGEQLEQLLPKA